MRMYLRLGGERGDWATGGDDDDDGDDMLSPEIYIMYLLAKTARNVVLLQ